MFVSACAETGLEFLHGTVGVSFDSEIPGRAEDFHVMCAWNKFPTAEDISERVEFLSHGVVEIVLKWTGHSFVVGEDILFCLLLVRFGRKGGEKTSRVMHLVD